MTNADRTEAIIRTGNRIANLGYYLHRLYQAIDSLTDEQLTQLDSTISHIAEHYGNID